MSEFDITGAAETPAQRATFGETLRRARAVKWTETSAQLLSPLTTVAAAHEMVAVVERKHRAALKASRQRGNTLEWSLLGLGSVSGILSLVTPNAGAHAVLGLAAIMCAAVAVGSIIRGWL